MSESRFDETVRAHEMAARNVEKVDLIECIISSLKEMDDNDLERAYALGNAFELQTQIYREANDALETEHDDDDETEDEYEHLSELFS